MAEQTPTAREFADDPGLAMDIAILLEAGVVRHLGRLADGSGWMLELVGEVESATPLELQAPKLSGVVNSAFRLTRRRGGLQPDPAAEEHCERIRAVLAHPLFGFLRRDTMVGGRTLTSLALPFDDQIAPEHAVATTTWRSAFAAAHQILQEESDA